MQLTLTATSEDRGVRIDAWLAAHVEGLTRSAAAKLLESGGVAVNGVSAAKNYRLTGGETVEVTRPEAEEIAVEPQDIPLDVVYEDEDVIVVNKPTGMVVHPAPGHPDGTLVNALLYHCGESLSGVGGQKRPGIVHRIDRDTWPWRPSWRTTPWPGRMSAWRWAISGRTAALSTRPSAAIRWTASAWRWCARGAGRP